MVAPQPVETERLSKPMTDITYSEDDITLAGEFALHLLDPTARAAFEARLLNDASLRALVRDWDEDLCTIANEVTEITPPKHLQSQIETSLFGHEESKIWAFLGLGKAGWAMCSLALVALLTFFALDTDQPDQSLVATFMAEDESLQVAALLNPALHELTLVRSVGKVAAGRSQELWLIVEGAPAPVSLGLLDANADSKFILTDAQADVFWGATLAISDEPLGGSPTGAPTGAVLAAVKMEKV